MTSPTPLLALQGIGKRYGSVEVLRDVDFTLAHGEVHALVGENGAGKSTLSHIIAGLIRPDSGAMALDGEAYAPATRRDAADRGIRMVMQELNLIGTLTVAESIFLENLPHRRGWIDRRRLHEQTHEALSRVGLADLAPTRLVSSLGVGQQQLVEIAAGLSRRCDLLILDEPTASLTEPETERLFEQIGALRAGGTTVLYISHRLQELQRIADRLTVLRDGRMIETRPIRDWPLSEIVRAMVGRDLPETTSRARRTRSSVALRVSGLRRAPIVCDVSFELHRSEILGFAGLMGSGRTETMRAIVGADRPDAGEIRLGETAPPARIRSPRDAVRAGIALLTEDRKEQGLLLPLSIRANISLPNLASLRGFGGWIHHREERRQALRWSDVLRVHCRDIEQPAAELSGGNQQKVVIAKWLLRDCDVLIFDEPTRGIDVGARFEIHRLLEDLAARGKAIIVVSSDLPELLAVADRIAVMSAGRLVATYDRDACTPDQIMHAALGEPASGAT